MKTSGSSGGEFWDASPRHRPDSVDQYTKARWAISLPDVENGTNHISAWDDEKISSGFGGTLSALEE